MEEKPTTAIKTGLIYGIILGLALIIYSVLLYILDLNLNNYLNWISYLILIAVIVYATLNYRKSTLNGNISYGQALGIAMIIIVCGSILSSFYNYIFVTVIDPEYIEKALAVAEEELIKRGMPDDQIEMGLSVQRKMMQPFIMSLLAFVMNVFFGFILALITSAFLKKEGDPYQEAMQDIEE